MNKFIIFVLLSLTIACSTGQPGGKGSKRDGERKGPKKYSQCALEKCEEEIKNLKALFHGTKEKDECSKKCNPENKKFHHLDEKEVKKIKQCYEENGCDPKKKFNHRNSTEFRKVEECVNEKCPDDKKKFKTTTLPTTPEVSTAI